MKSYDRLDLTNTEDELPPTDLEATLPQSCMEAPGFPTLTKKIRLLNPELLITGWEPYNAIVPERRRSI